MSDVKRAYDILRGYVGREWDRIKDIEWAEAAKELLVPAGEPAANPNETGPSVEAVATPAEPTDYQQMARQILGVTIDDDFTTIRKAFERLNSRTNPALFPAGSAEAAQAAQLRDKVTWAYQFLTVGTDETQKRFGSLEIES